ncbi:MAG: hypothetical protein WBW62_04685 [Solirubrobacterales bacterium]
MRETTGRSRRVSAKAKAVIVALFAIFAVTAFGASSATAASTPGSPFAASFNHVGLNVNVSIAGDINELVLKPSDGIGELDINGTYDDAAGNFTIPKDGGLVFPDIELDLDGIHIDGAIGLSEAGSGTYNDVTGELMMDTKISLTLGTDEISELPDPVGGLGSGPLECRFSPLAISFSTNPINWPAPGKAFEDPANLTDGAVAGSFTTKPDVESIQGGTLCTILHGFLGPVGGLYLANKTVEDGTMPAATGPKPDPDVCDPGEEGTPPNCVTPPVEVPCPTGYTGIEPDCVKDEDPKTAAAFTKVKVTPAKGTIKAGKKLTLKVKVTNTGETTGTAKIVLKSSNKKVKAPKTVKVKVAAGKTVTKKITIKANKKAKGKAVITAKVGKKSGKSKLKIKKKK